MSKSIAGDGRSDLPSPVSHTRKNEKGGAGVALVIRPAFDSPEDVRELFAEYTAILVAGDPAFQGYLDQQNYEHELTHLLAMARGIKDTSGSAHAYHNANFKKLAEEEENKD